MLRKIIRFLSGSILFRKRGGVKNFSPMSDLDDELATLLQLFDQCNCPVFLVGGIGMAVRLGGFYRNHKDFDLAVFTEDIPEFREYLTGKGYRFVRRAMVVKIAPKWYIQFYMPFESRSIKKLYAGKHVVKLLRMDRRNSFTAKGRLDLIDVLLLGKTDEGVYDYAYKTTIPWEHFYPAETLSDTSSLQLPNIKYKQYLPAYTKRSKEDLERADLSPI